MHKGRLEAFSDGVLAIIITIMVLELKPPHGGELSSLRPLIPVFISYVLSFVYVGIYWNNHHHMFQSAQKVNGATLWANLHLLFWLSLVPATTAWMGENNFSTFPVLLYGVNLFMAALSYTLLVGTLVRLHGKDSAFARALAGDTKGKISLVLYVTALSLALVQSWLAFALYVTVAIIWFVPDRRFEDPR